VQVYRIAVMIRPTTNPDKRPRHHPDRFNHRGSTLRFHDDLGGLS
jgi:hypothetical protein